MPPPSPELVILSLPPNIGPERPRALPSGPSLGQHRIDDFAQCARRRRRIWRERQCRDHGDAAGAGRDDLGGVAGVDAGDAGERQIWRAAAEHGNDARQSFGADRLVLLLFR